MSEPPAENLSAAHLDPPSKPASPLDQHFAKHRQEPATNGVDESASSRRPDVTAHASRNASSGASYNTSLRYGGGGDAPSVGDSIHSGDEFTVRSDDGGGGDSVASFNASREAAAAAAGEEETARLLRGGSQSSFPNPYRKRQQQQQQIRQQGPNRVSFAEQLFGKTYDSNSSVVASVVGSISGTVATGGPGVRRKVPRVTSNSTSAASSSNGAPSSLTSELLTKRLQKFKSIKKNATLLSILTMGVIIFIGACFSLSEIPNGTTAEPEEEARGLGYENDGTASSAFSLGIMDNIHPHLQAAAPIIADGSYASSASSQSDPQAASSQQIDWNKVPPHLRGYYSKTFGPPPSSNGARNTLNDPVYGPNNSYNGLQDAQESEYQKSQFANAQAAMAIQSIGKEAVLGFRPMTGRDYHAQGELNKELTSAGMGSGAMDNEGFHSDGVGFSGPMLRKEEFVMQEEQQLWGQQQQQQQQQKSYQPVDSEDQKRIAAQEAALSKASTAEDDARKKREEELLRLRASAGLTGFYYPQKEASAEGANVDDAAKQKEQSAAAAAIVAAAAAEEVKEKLELVRQRMKEEAEAAQNKEEEALQQEEDEARQQKAEAEAKQKLEDEIRQRNEDEARKQEETRQREEEAARQQEMARQEAAEKAAKQKLEMLQEQKAEEVRQRNSRPSFAQELLTKYLKVPFRDQTKEVSIPQPPPPPAAKQPNYVPSEQEQIPEPSKQLDKPEQAIPSLSNQQQPVQHDQPQQQNQQSPSQAQNQPPPDSLKQQQPPQQQGQPPPQQSAQLRLQVQNGQLSFDDWRSKMKQKLHNQIQEDIKKNAPPPPPKPSQAEMKDKVSQKMEEVEQAQSAVMKGQSTDLDSIASLQKELSELLAIMGGT